MNVSAESSVVHSDSRLSLYLPWLYVALLAGSLSGNVLLGIRVRTLKNASNVSSFAIERRVGQRIPQLAVSDSNGKPSQLNFLGQRTVLYIFDPGCHWCARNLGNLRALAAHSGSSYRIVGLSRTGNRLSSYVEANQLKFPVFIEERPEDYKQLDYQGTPQTIVVGADGTIVHNWPGAYSEKTQEAVEQYFTIHLPGLL